MSDRQRPRHRLRGPERGARHADRREDARLHHVSERPLVHFLQREPREGESRVGVRERAAGRQEAVLVLPGALIRAEALFALRTEFVGLVDEAAGVRQQLRERGRAHARRQSRHVSGHRLVEGQHTVRGGTQDRRRRERLRHRANLKERVRRDWRARLHVGHTEAACPHHRVAHHHGHGGARNAGLLHLGANCGLGGGKCRVTGGRRRGLRARAGRLDHHRGSHDGKGDGTPDGKQREAAVRELRHGAILRGCSRAHTVAPIAGSTARHTRGHPTSSSIRHP